MEASKEETCQIRRFTVIHRYTWQLSNCYSSEPREIEYFMTNCKVFVMLRETVLMGGSGRGNKYIKNRIGLSNLTNPASTSQVQSFDSIYDFFYSNFALCITPKVDSFSNIMSTTIAIAGGTGNVGRTISDALVATAKYNVILLGRGVSEHLSSTT